MIICGLKLTHDSNIAIIENGRLIRSVELEKLDNNARFKILDNLEQIPVILKNQGYDMDDIDSFVVDGWVGLGSSVIKTRNRSGAVQVPVAAYHEKDLLEDITAGSLFSSLLIDGYDLPYESYTHVAGHIFSSYCSSPFARSQQDAFVLVWDGGMYPRLYFIKAAEKRIINLGALFYTGVNIYSIFAQHFGPFKINENVIKDELSIAGKVMAYIALGNMVPEIVNILKEVYAETIEDAVCPDNIPCYPYQFSRRFRDLTTGKGFSDEDVLASFHFFLEEMLLTSLASKMAKLPFRSSNICLAGGAALNIKWNSAIRNTGLFEAVWVCPFPNDSGSAIGAASCAWFKRTGSFILDWNVYSGPDIIENDPPAGWVITECDLNALAQLLHNTNEPVIFLNGPAELGPRALGNRSIICTATGRENKRLLNNIKYRELYRPVAPVCMEEKAAAIFSPGCPDPYMLFDHIVKEEWRPLVPAICHIDGTARLQTVSHDQHPLMYELLVRYETISGIPLLCNTSANLKGSGFFPDIHHACKWNIVNYVWCNGKLYEKPDKSIP